MVGMISQSRTVGVRLHQEAHRLDPANRKNEHLGLYPATIAGAIDNSDRFNTLFAAAGMQGYAACVQQCGDIWRSRDLSTIALAEVGRQAVAFDPVGQHDAFIVQARYGWEWR